MFFPGRDHRIFVQYSEDKSSEVRTHVTSSSFAINASNSSAPASCGVPTRSRSSWMVSSLLSTRGAAATPRCTNHCVPATAGDLDYAACDVVLRRVTTTRRISQAQAKVIRASQVVLAVQCFIFARRVVMCMCECMCVLLFGICVCTVCSIRRLSNEFQDALKKQETNEPEDVRRSTRTKASSSSTTFSFPFCNDQFHNLDHALCFC
jgi:hypothetical protein